MRLRWRHDSSPLPAHAAHAAHVAHVVQGEGSHFFDTPPSPLLQADLPTLEALHPCVVCQAETSPEAFFCPPCWAARLRRSPRFCEHRLAAWDPIGKRVLCATCEHTLVREGTRFVLAAATIAKPDAEPAAPVEIERGAARGGAR